MPHRWSVSSLSSALRTSLALLLLAAVAACSSTNSPTSPGTGGQAQIVSITPSPVLAMAGAQTIIVNGEQFINGLQLEVTRPGGQTTVISGASIQSVTSSSFRTSIVFDVPGNYTLLVRNPSGTASAPFTVTAASPDASAPTISAVTPNTVLHSEDPVLVSLQGAGFSTSPTVSVTSPSGFVTMLARGSLSLATTTSVQFVLTLNTPGIYTINLINQTGTASNPVIIVVT